MSKKDKEIKWCPTQGGNTVGYNPQYKDKYDDWRAVPTMQNSDGIPASKFRTKAIHDLGLFTYAQAQALAWTFAAFTAAETGIDIEVRVQEYEVVYDLKARPLSSED
jgi:hypothetical protein